MSDSPNLKAIPQMAIASADPQKLSAFYRDVLGLAVMFETAGMTFLNAGNVRLMIGPAQGANPGDKIIYLEPEDFAAAEAALVARGVTFGHDAQPLQREPGRELVLRPFTDPDGNALALMGWRPRS